MKPDPFEGCSVKGARIELANGEVLSVQSEPERIREEKPKANADPRFRVLVRRGRQIQIVEVPAFVVLAWEMAGGKVEG